MSLQLAYCGATDGTTGTATLTITGALETVSHVDFYTVVVTSPDGSGDLSGPFPPDRTPSPGVYEKDTPLDASRLTRVEAVVTLTDLTTQRPVPESVTFESRAQTPPTIRSLAVGSEYGRVQVAVVPGSACSWKCWARAGAWPTTDSTPAFPLRDEYLRLEARRDQLAIQLPGWGAEGVMWYVVAVGYDAAGIAGPRLTGSVALTHGAATRAHLVLDVLQVDGVEQRQVEVVEELKLFTDWLGQHDVAGFIGEVGWPWGAVTAWNQVASTWFTDANAAHLWVTAWAVGEWWGSYHLQPYALESGAWVEKPQALVLEDPQNVSGANYKRGLNVAGAEFGAPVTDTESSFSNLNPGAHGTAYIWNGASTYEYMYSQGHRLARIPFRWERIQPALGLPLDALELQRMRDSVNAAIAAGFEVVLDVHNYGGYYLHDVTAGVGVRRTIGSPQVTFEHFADLWRRLAEEFNAYAGVIGYGLINEPVAMTPAAGMTEAKTWETAAQAAIDGIRGVTLPPGAVAKWILVGGYEWSGVWSPDVNHSGPFVTDPANLIRYEGHQYFDYNRSGGYSQNELDPVLESNWVRWKPNARMWKDSSEASDTVGTPLQVETYRVGTPTALKVEPLWRKGVADAPMNPCMPGSQDCGHKTYEYRVLVRDPADGTTTEYHTSISGPYLD